MTTCRAAQGFVQVLAVTSAAMVVPVQVLAVRRRISGRRPKTFEVIAGEGNDGTILFIYLIPYGTDECSVLYTTIRDGIDQ